MNLSQRLLAAAGTVFAAVLLVAPPAYAPCHIITFTNDAHSADEDDGTVTITLTNGGGQGTPTVDYETVDDSAKAPADYTAKSGTVQFVFGQSESSFKISIKDDTADEPNERFFVKLSNADGACAPPPAIQGDTATVTIRDNDEKPVAQPTPTPTRTTPRPRPSTVSATPSPSPSPTTATPSPSPTVTASPIAAPAETGGGLSGGAIAGIAGAVVVLGGAGAFWVRRRFLA